MFPYQYGQTSQNQLAYEQSLKNIINQANGQLQQLQNQPQMPMQQPQIHQNFQLAPNLNTSELESKYANSIEEVKNTFVMKTGVFLDKDLNNLWIKNTNGDIRTFELNEIIRTDPKDEEINNLRQELQRMKEMIANESNVNNSDYDGANEGKKSARIPVRKQSNAK